MVKITPDYSQKVHFVSESVNKNTSPKLYEYTKPVVVVEKNQQNFTKTNVAWFKYDSVTQTIIVPQTYINDVLNGNISLVPGKYSL